MSQAESPSEELERLRKEVARLRTAFEVQQITPGVTEQRLGMLIDHLPIGMVYQLRIDTQGNRKFTYISAAVVRNHGLTQDEVYADANTLYSQIDPRDSAALAEQEVISERDGMVFSMEVRYTPPGGEMRWALLRSAPLRLADGSTSWDGVEFDITERKRAEETLRDSTRELQTMIRAAPVGICRVRDRVFLTVNQIMTDLFGYTQEEFIGMPTLNMYASPEEYERVGTVIYSDLHKEGFMSVDLLCKRKDGSPIYINLRSALFNPDDASAGYISMVLDISERKRQEEALRKNERRLALAVGATADAVWEWDVVSNQLYYSPRWYEMLGYKVGEVDTTLGAAINLIHPDDTAQIEQGFQQALGAEGSAVNIEIRMRHKDGRWIWIHCRGNAVDRDAQGRPTLISGTNTDVSERKSQEEALRKNERRLALAIGATADAIWEWDLKTDKTYYSPRFYEMLGYKDRQFEMTLEAWKALAHPDDIQPTMDAVQTVLNSPGSPGYKTEFRMRAADGRWVWIEARGNVVDRDHEGKALTLSGTNTDITERKDAEQEKLRLRAQLEQAMKMEAVGQLAGGIAHDFNNLITVITGNVELARFRLPQDPEILHYIDEIQRASGRAASLTRQLLTFSRRQIIEPKLLNLNELAGNVQRMLLRLIGEDIELQSVFHPDLYPVKIDAGQFEQVLVNLAVNARDAMPNGGKLLIETRNIEIDASYCEAHPDAQPGSYAMLAVTDTGQGMDEHIRKHIFEPFFTTKEVGKGTGLGLAMVFGAVKQAEGSVEVYSEVGHGTTFKIYLPRCKEAASPSVKPTPVLELSPGTETLLFVEDEPSVREIGLIVLNQLGYQVLHAQNGVEALKVAADFPGKIDLLMTDVVMPGKNGREVAETLRQTRPETKVLFTSGYTENVIGHHGVLDSNINFIGKPYSPQSLTRKIREVLGSRK